MIAELKEWLETNKIQYTEIDNDVFDIPEFGKCFVVDTEKSSFKSIFRKDADKNVVFNSTENVSILQDEGVFYYVFKFGDNWFYYDTRADFKMNILKYVGKMVPVSLENPPKFANLGIHSCFELLNGSFQPIDWAKKAKYLGYEAIGICDYNTMAGTLALQKACKEYVIKHIFGYSCTCEDRSGNKFGIKIYSITQQGMRNMLRIQKAINVDSETHTLPIHELFERCKGNALVFDKYASEWAVEHKDEFYWIMDLKWDYVFYQVDFSEYKSERIDVRLLNAQKLYFDELYDDVSPILIPESYYLDKSDSKNKIILNKIASGAAHEQSNDQYFKDIDELYSQFVSIIDDNKWDVKDLFNECCENTLYIADNAVAKYDTDRNYMPQYMLTDEEKEKYGTRHNMFVQLIEEGFSRLVPEENIEEYRKRVEYEKYILESTDNIDYMLVQYDTVNWARKNGILVGAGRGSAGGSLVLYLLGITLIDPMKYDLIFERFLLPERAGLYPSDVTIIAKDVQSTDYIEVTFENDKILKIDKDAQMIVSREGKDKPVIIYADELQQGDDIIFDNRDLLFTLKEIEYGIDK